MTMMIEMTEAKTGRSMKNFEIIASPRWPAPRRRRALGRRLASCFGCVGEAFTGAPGRTRMMPSTMIARPP